MPRRAGARAVALAACSLALAAALPASAEPPLVEVATSARQ